MKRRWREVIWGMRGRGSGDGGRLCGCEVEVAEMEGGCADARDEAEREEVVWMGRGC